MENLPILVGDTQEVSNHFGGQRLGEFLHELYGLRTCQHLVDQAIDDFLNMGFLFFNVSDGELFDYHPAQATMLRRVEADKRSVCLISSHASFENMRIALSQGLGTQVRLSQCLFHILITSQQPRTASIPKPDPLEGRGFPQLLVVRRRIERRPSTHWVRR